MRKLLVVEDEDSIRSFIVLNLQRAGYDVLE
ncbi:MAG: DNA-binding response regulator, partial [Clostridia bacterium]|nr:DNA-binding response regulator [Clostridia bacterium]